MRQFRAVVAIMLALACESGAQVTRTATFENFTIGQSFARSFTDGLSGISFRDSTHPPTPSGFVINYSPTYFGGSQYLTSSGPGISVLGSYFGFTADLPSPANHVVLDVLYHADDRSRVVLSGYSAGGGMVAQQAGPVDALPAEFVLQITSVQFDIATFRVSVGSGFAGYDNIAYTIVPEPTLMLPALVAGALLCRLRR